MNTIDLRSDTITHPTDEMRRAMAEAKVGDDVLGDDPTVRRLEELAASRMGKQDGLFVPSGTMGNLISQMVHCGRGDESILGDQSHVFWYEQGGSAGIGNIHPRTLPNSPDGTIPLEMIEAAIRPDDIHFPRSRLLIIENTHNRCKGTPIPLTYMKAVRKLADRHRLNIHVDGARIFNAAAALEIDIADLAGPADSITFCLSKGLAAPVGSVVCGDRPFIGKARRIRKVLGGGMRQSGILAAAGIVALETMVDRLADDHANARALALGLSQIRGLAVDPDKIKTNIVYFDVVTDEVTALELTQLLDKSGVRMLASGPGQIRAVTNYHVGSGDIEQATSVIREAMASV
ncbi:MAG: low-specificity L-threonine aldolase [Desulfobacteraceae bacterium]|nr:low-specificity L-threonine aldolase [Desulfobacteraceae bacterium]